ncbi:MAG: hypothetical protein DMD29_05070 [Gemmatimonadetes bacterium]|nr:MAG: hypothetical protein DMD29_05070 [Gemmatimonadota bacterium]
MWGLGTWAVLACGHPPVQNPTPAPTAPLPTAGISGQQVGILPITLIAAEDTLHWDTVVSERDKADSVLTTLLKARAPEVGWVSPQELRRMARRAPGIATDPEQMATPLLRDPRMVQVIDPLRNQLRTLAAIAGGLRYVLAPAGLVYRHTAIRPYGDTASSRPYGGTATAELTVVLVDVRLGRVAWRTVARGEADDPWTALTRAVKALTPGLP